jgi:hypothetical protein
MSLLLSATFCLLPALSQSSLPAALALNAATGSTYSQEDGKYFIDFAGAAYCSGTLGHGVKKWDCNACKKHPNVNVTAINANGLFYAFNGFIAHDADTNKIILSIAGTDPLNLQNWIDDLDFKKTPYDLCAKHGNSTCSVDEGFLGIYNYAKDQVRATMKAYTKHYPDATVHITGHSLGAALAVFAGLDLELEMNIPVATIYTAGEPRGGDIDWAEFLIKNFDSRHFRQTHFTDPIPHLAPEKFGFAHATQEIYYEQHNSLGKYKECSITTGEDYTCSDKNVANLNLLMHLSYLGFDFTSNYLSCKL